MTVSSTTRKAGPTPGNGVTTSFPFAFKVFDATDVVVTLVVLSTGVETPLVLTTDYTVSLNADQDANPGGSITYNPASGPLTALSTLTISSNVAPLQGSQLTSGGAFLPEVVEAMADKATICIQQMTEIVSRSVKFPVVDSPLSTTLPAAAQRANKALVFDASGNASVSLSNYNDQTAAVQASATAAALSAAAAAASATSASASSASATASAGNANTSAGAAAAAASTAQGYIGQALGFTLSTLYDFGSVADPVTLFPTNLGTVP